MPDANRIADRLIQAVALMSKCRYSEFTDLALNSVIASEAILNPTNEKDNLAERFALFGAAILSDDSVNRKTVYDHLKRLYNYRSTLVHSAKRAPLRLETPRWSKEFVETMEFDYEAEDKIALKYFLKFYCIISDWLINLLEKNPGISNTEVEQRFKEFYLDTIL